MRTRLSILLLVSAACLACAAQTSEPPNLFPIQDGFVDSHGALIYYQSVGHGAPLMTVHGGPGSSHDYFLPYLLPLMRTSRLVFIDERGSGKSSKIEDAKQYTIANMVEDIEAVRQALGLGRISPICRLVFIDERGSGKSSKIEDAKQYTIANMVEDIEAVRQALGLGKISLLG